MKNLISKTTLFLSITLLLSSCGTIGKIGDIGSAPDLAPIEQTRVDPQEMQGPIPVRQAVFSPSSHEKNSLWKTGSRSFFPDQRAAKIGDILTVNITIDDQASINNATSRTRSNSDELTWENYLG
jgi:flagellar L-ring protein FlgH